VAAEEHITKKKSIAEATKLNKYVPEADNSAANPAATEAKRREEALLEEHLMESSVREVEVALANRFLPLMMLPEAAQYSADHQTRYRHIL
jgi:hypothetical protein